MSIRVVVSGTGSMGRFVIGAITAEPDMEVVGVLEKFADTDTYALPHGPSVPQRHSVGDLAALGADVVVDFTNAAWTTDLLPAALAAGVRPVVGTTGLSEAFVAQVRAQAAAARIGGVIASNFALGAVMMMHLARIAAPFFEAVEVIEQHHDGKVDAPSGTAVTTARLLRAAHGRDFQRNVPERETLPGARGAEHGGVSVHAVRLPGLVAHQSVIFGGLGETLTLRHDSISRESFMPGVVRAVRAAPDLEEIVVGLDRLLGLAAD